MSQVRRGTVPLSQCAQNANAKRRVKEGARDTCPQAPGRGVEVEHEGGNGLDHRADSTQPGNLGTPESCAFLGP